MFGAIIGDIAGSRYEFDPVKSKDVPLFGEGSTYTDDTVLTVAVANALLKARETGGSFREILIPEMQRLGNAHAQGEYGVKFASWLRSDDPQPYNSFGNGSAMRVSPCALIAVSLDEALALARASAEVTHDHTEGIKGDEAVAGAVFMADMYKTKEDIKSFVEDGHYRLGFTLDSIRGGYGFDETCQGSVPQAIVAFLESESYEDAIRNAISLGGDADTQAAIAGSIAWRYYADRRCEPYVITHQMIMEESGVLDRLPAEFVQTIQAFEDVAMRRRGTYERVGRCRPIPL